MRGTMSQRQRGILLPLLFCLCWPGLGAADLAPAATAATAATPAPAATATYLSFRVRPGDALTITVLDHPELSVDVTVTEEGNIQLPVVGELAVAGLTLREVTAVVTAGLQPSLGAPEVTVAITEAEAGPQSTELRSAPTASVVQPQEEWAKLPRFGANVFGRAIPAAASGEGTTEPSSGAPGTNAPVPPNGGATPATGVGQGTTAQSSGAPGTNAPLPPRRGATPAAVFGQGTTAQSGGAPVTNAPVPPNYVIGPGDTLSVEVWARQQQQISQTAVVNSDGQVVFPLVGVLGVSGQTLDALRLHLAEAYRSFFDDPTVTLVLPQQRIVEVYVTGEAVQPGKQTLSGMATVFTALYAAGGPAEIGSYRNVQLLRVGQPAVRIDLYEYLLYGRREGDLLLQPGDTVFIPPVRQEVGVAGEVRRPARYELDGETTAAQTLAMAGGLTATAYPAGAQLWRTQGFGEWRLLDLDLTDPAAEGYRTPLADGDLLLVPPVLREPTNLVYLRGAVRRPGDYPATPGLTLGELLAQAQGLSEDAHLGTGALRRLNAQLDYDLIHFSVGEASTGGPAAALPLQPRDIVEIFTQTQVERPFEVSVSGEVVHPGTYTWSQGMRVADLLLIAGGPQPGAYLERADLLRITPDQRWELLSANLAAAQAGEGVANLELQRGDRLQVALRDQVLPPAMVQVSGLVQKPGSYPRREGMRVTDLIFAAGGLLPGAGPEVELAAGRQEGPTQVALLRLEGTPESFRIDPDPVLQDDDAVAIQGRGEFRVQAAMVYLQGEVARPGSYVLKIDSKQDPYTLWDLLQESGGLLPNANPQGIVLYRQSSQGLDTAQSQDLAKLVRAINREAPPQPSTMVGPEAQAQAMTANLTQGLATVVSGPETITVVLPPVPVDPQAAVAAVPVAGQELLASAGHSGNMVLEPGDTVVVPRLNNTVTLLGAVVRSGAMPYVAGREVKEYLANAGGFRDDAAQDRMVIVHANGAVSPLNRRTIIEPGDVIVVPSQHVVRSVPIEPAWKTWLKSIVQVAAAVLLRGL